MTISLEERVVTLNAVEEALKQCPPAERGYDTDNHQSLPLRLGFAKCDVSMVFVCLRTLRHQGKLRKKIEPLGEGRRLKHGGRNCPVRRVSFVFVEEGATPERPGRRSLGYFAR